jgi:uncharacterized protein with von Willebrand factor type A (vWA) domain
MTNTQYPIPDLQGGYLLGHILRFGRMLRLMGVQVSLRQMLDLVEATQYVPITEQLNFYCAARALLVNRREDLPVFDQAFEIFWRSIHQPQLDQKRSGPGKRARLPGEPDAGPPGGEQSEQLEHAPGEGAGEPTLAAQIARYSPLEILRHKDFGEMSWEEIQAAKRAIAQLDWKLGERRTRRYHPGHKGRLDLRRVMRDNLSKGGELVTLAHRMRAHHPRPLVILCDVSGSMERYSRMLLHFIHALTHGLTGVDVEAFVFGTRLTRVTHHLRHKDVDESMDQVGKTVLDWSGGTRIGEAIKTFNFQWARRVLGRGAVVLIISDGWDRGDVDLLTCEMARLQRSAYRLMWLNPLVGANEYQPSQRGMAAALAFVDDLLPGCNLASLEQLAGVLSDVRLHRPERKQHPRLPQTQQVGAPESVKVQEHPFVKVVAEYPWLKMFDELGKLNNGQR